MVKSELTPEAKYNHLIGLDLEDAKALLKVTEPEMYIQVSKEDNQYLILLSYYSSLRLRVETVNGKVSKIDGLG